jgi:hypothetical protein
MEYTVGVNPPLSSSPGFEPNKASARNFERLKKGKPT